MGNITSIIAPGGGIHKGGGVGQTQPSQNSRKREREEREEVPPAAAAAPPAEPMDVVAPGAQPQTKRFCDNGSWGVYVGELDAKGLRHGKGEMRWENGVWYEGEWKNNRREGQGTFEHSGNRYEGQWKDDKMEGRVTCRYENGDEYVGGYKDDKRSGRGTYYWNDGEVDIGTSSAGEPSGEGVRWSKDRRTAWLLQDGEEECEISPNKAKEVAAQLGFSRSIEDVIGASSGSIAPSVAKKIRSGPRTGPEEVGSRDEIDCASIGLLSVDTIATIFGYLTWKEILPARVSRALRNAATLTLVPFTPDVPRRRPEFCVNSLRRYEALAGMVRALPNLQQICFGGDRLMKFEDGEEPEPTFLEDDDHLQHRGQNLQFDPDDIPTRQINIIADFPKLRSLGICGVHLNGTYPCLLGFPHLQRLHIQRVEGLKFDLEMLFELPLLEVLDLERIPLLQGSMRSLRALKDTLRSISIIFCPAVGDLMDLADFPRLKKLHLTGTAVKRDVRQIGDRDFPMLRWIFFPCGAAFERISDAPEVMNAICRLKRRVFIQNTGQMKKSFWWYLASDSPERYPPVRISALEPPFFIEIVEVDSCIGWRWTNGRAGGVCKTNWLDDEPDRKSLGGAKYWRQMDNSPYKDFVNPPSEAEYQQLHHRTVRG